MTEMEILSAASTTALLASVSSAIGTTSTGVYGIIAIAIALPTMFFFFKMVAKMFTGATTSLHNKMYTDPKEVSTVEYVEHRMRRADYDVNDSQKDFDNDLDFFKSQHNIDGPLSSKQMQDFQSQHYKSEDARAIGRSRIIDKSKDF